MAQARLERIGTVFSRVQALLKGGAMKKEDRPLWYVIYQAFPPKYNPTFAQKTIDVPIRPIIYEEDHIRAKLHKYCKEELPAIDLSKQSGLITHVAMSHLNVKLTDNLDQEKSMESVFKDMHQSLKKISTF